MSLSLPDQHEDNACCDVQTADRTGDSCLHIEETCMEQCKWMDGREFIFLLFPFWAFAAMPYGASRPHFSGFVLNYIVIMAL